MTSPVPLVPALPDPADQRSAAVATRALAFLYTAGASLGLAALLLPRPEAINVPVIVVTATAAYAVAALLMLVGPLPRAALHLSLGLGTALITVAVHYSGQVAGAYAFYYLWVVLFASYFFSRRGVATHIAMIAVAYGAMLVIWEHEGWGLGWAVTVGSLMIAAVLVRAMKEQLDRLVGQLAHAAETDVLTGLLNRRGFNERLASELDRAGRSGRPLSLVVGDLDRFKEVNDRYGHPAGDEALRRVGALMHEAKRANDMVARIGGEEFALILPYTDQLGARTLAERMRKEISSAFADDMLALTISFGIATYPDDGWDVESLMRSADRALYAAKDLGRNRSVWSADEVLAATSEDGTDAPAAEADGREPHPARPARSGGRFPAAAAEGDGPGS